MSYLVVLFNLPSHIVSLDDLPDGDGGDSDTVVMPPLGLRTAILALLTSLFPDADYADPTWVVLRRNGFVIEFMLGAKDPLSSLGLRIHGSDQALDVAKLLCEYMGWRAYDTSLGDFIDFEDHPAAGLQAWRQYRNRVIEPRSDEPG